MSHPTLAGCTSRPGTCPRRHPADGGRLHASARRGTGSRGQRRPVRRHRRQPGRGDRQRDHADLAESCGCTSAQHSRRACHHASGSMSALPGRIRAGRSPLASHRCSRSELKTPSLRALVPTSSTARMSRLMKQALPAAEHTHHSTSAAPAAAAAAVGYRHAAGEVHGCLHAGHPVGAGDSRVDASHPACRGTPWSRRERGRARNSSSAIAGNELASETVPPIEPPIIAGNRKLAEPASTWNVGLRGEEVPRSRWTRCPSSRAMLGCPARRRTSSGRGVTPQNPGALYEEDRDPRGIRERGEVPVEDLVGHLLAEIARGRTRPKSAPRSAAAARKRSASRCAS